jgi:hypothetical protein
MNLKEHARFELNYAGLFDNDSDYNGEIARSVMELIDVFSNQGHSGASASIVRSVFNELAQYNPLGGITGEDSEWMEVSSGLFQNKRLSGVFKDINENNGKPYYLDAIIWMTKSGKNTWSGIASTRDRKKIISKQLIKKLPFNPRTFYVEVYELENQEDSFIITEKGMDQLKDVFEYYDFYEINK